MAWRRPGLPPLLIGHGLLGMAIGAAAALALLFTDIVGLASLIARVPDGAAFAWALVPMLATTCGGAQIAFAIGLHAREAEDDEPGTPLPIHLPASRR